MKKTVWIVISVLLLFSLVLAACKPTQKEQTGGTVRYAVLSDMTSTNVWALYDETDASYWNYVVQSGHWPALYGLSDQRYDIIPALAADMPSDFVQEGDLYVSTVPMKADLVWSDGSPLTADDVAFTANMALKFRLGLNWNSAYNPDYLVKTEAVDPLTVKFFFTEVPGLAIWQYGAMMGPIVSKAFWEPKVGEAVAKMDAVANLAIDSDEYVAGQAEAVDILHKLDSTGEPTYGAFKLEKWEVGAFSQTKLNPKNFFIGTWVEEYANGAYKEYKEDGSYTYTAFGEPEGEPTLKYKAGPYFDSALYTLYEADAAVLALRNNDVDFILTPNGISQGQLAQLRDDPAIQIVLNPQNGFRYLAFNQNRPFLADVALRQAIAAVIDMDFVTNQVLQGQAVPVYTLVPEGNGFWYNPDVPKFGVGMDTKSRMELAVSILKDAGYTWETEPAWNEDRGGSVDYGVGLMLPDGTPFPEITLLAPSAGYDPLRATSAVYIEQYMRSLGIPVTAQLTNFNNILSAVYDTGDYDMFILGWGLSIYPDYLCSFFDQTNGNPYGYVSPTLAAKCDEFYLETDIDNARAQVFEIQNILATELPYITLFTNPVYDAYRNLEYPYTEVLDGIGSGLYGAPTIVKPFTAAE